MGTGTVSGPARLSARARALTESATLALNARAKELASAGRPVINLSAGAPDFATPAHVVEAAAAACRDRLHHAYSATSGTAALKALIASVSSTAQGREVTPEQVLVTNGAKQAIAHVFGALLDPGDEVLLPTPHWPTYPEAIRLAGGVPVPVVADETTRYRVGAEALEAARSERTRLVVLVSPGNPTGSVYSREELEAIGRWALDSGIWVLSDEIYRHLVYDGVRAWSPPAVVPELAGQCVVVDGVSKAYAMTGWRVGWAVGPADVVRAAANLQSHTTSNVCNVAQAAAAAALGGDPAPVEHLRQVLDRRRRTLVGALRRIDGLVCPTPEGAFFAYPSVKRLLGGHRPRTSAQLAEVLLDEAEVAVVPGEVFGTPGHLRLSYAVDDEQLAEGTERLRRFFSGATIR